MKRLVQMAAVLWLFAGCTHADTAEVIEHTEVREVGVPETMPTELRYERLHFFSAYYGTDDPEIITEMLGAIAGLELGEAAEEEASDYTDRIVFAYEDGSKAVYDFNMQNLLCQDGKRYEVKNFDRVQNVLERFVEEEE